METQSALSKAESPEKTAAGSALNAVRTSPEKASSSSAPAPPPAPVPAGPSDADLVEELKIARKALATQHKAMTTMIADTATLERIAQVKPRNMKELEEAAGFGKTRSERYGQPLLDCVAKHLEAIKAAGGSIGGDEEQSPAAATDATASSSSTKATGAGASSSNDDDFIGEVTIVYSHYKDKFGLRLGNKLDFALVDAKYCLSAVFKGNFSIRLQQQQDGLKSEGTLKPDGGKLKVVDGEGGKRSANGTFSGLLPNAEYIVLIDEDPKHASKAPPSKGFQSATGGGGGGGSSIGGKSRGSALVTAELKKLSVEELKEGGAKYRQLLAERDLEDMMSGGDDAILGEDKSSCSCLFGNPCVSPNNCKDWRNRYEVAKANGWKGF